MSVAAKGVQFYGFKVCQSFSEETSVSEASYTLSPRKFKDINGVMVGPREGFKLTFEMLRRKADSALIWYEDFRDRIILPESYWAVLSGEWEVWQKDDLEKNKTDEFSIDITYSLKDSSQKQVTFNHSDIAKVTIMPSFGSDIKNGNYEITYVVPAGFRFIEPEGQKPFWVEENGLKLKFNFYYDKQNFAAIPITFYIQAAQTGVYTVDYTVIKEHSEVKLNYLDKHTLTVK